MALDFPANPTNGQIFGSYIWSASKGVWQSREESAAPAVVSSTPPTTPTTGDIWVDSSDGVSYVYYNDGTSGQWIEMISSGVVSLASKANLSGGNTFTGTQLFGTPIAIDSGGTGAASLSEAKKNLQILLSPNYIINGAFDIWQRGTSFTAPNQYTADRWFAQNSVAVNISRQSYAAEPIGVFYYLQATTTSATNTMFLTQAFEDIEAYKMRGKTVTFSFYATASAAVSVTARIDKSSTANTSSTGFSVISSNTVTLSASVTRYSVTAAIPSDNTANGLRVALTFSNIASGTNVNIFGVQLEEGSAPTPFRRNSNSIQEELSTCQRYFVAFPANGVNVWNSYFGVALSSGRQHIDGHFPQTMRANPTVLTSAGSNLHSFIYYPSNASTNATITLQLSANNTSKMAANYSSGQNGGNSLAAIYATGENNNPIWVSAEL